MGGHVPTPAPLPATPLPSSSRTASDRELSSEALSSAGQGGRLKRVPVPPPAAKTLPRHPPPPNASPEASAPLLPRRLSRHAPGRWRYRPGRLCRAVRRRCGAAPSLPRPGSRKGAGQVWGHRQGRSRRHPVPGPRGGWRGWSRGHGTCRGERGPAGMSATGTGTRQPGQILPPVGVLSLGGVARWGAVVGVQSLGMSYWGAIMGVPPAGEVYGGACAGEEVSGGIQGCVRQGGRFGVQSHGCKHGG